RRLAGTGGTDDRGRRARSGGEVQVFEDGDLGAGVSEGDVAELELASAGHLVDACWDSHTGAGIEHLCDALGADDGTRNHHHHEDTNHHGYEYLQEILQEGCQRVNFHLPGVVTEAAEPEHRRGRQVEDHHDRREYEDELVADFDR